MNTVSAANSDASGDSYITPDGRKIGGVLMDMRHITLRFGGVTAIKDISFDIREGEIRAIIGPNGAGKSSMMNVMSGFYVPQEGEVWFRGARRPQMRPYQVARQGLARTFQNIALFDGMSVLDNIMTGRLTLMNTGLLSQALWWGRAEAEENWHREKVEKIIDFLEIQNIRKTPVGRLPYGLKKRVELARALAAEPKLLMLDEPMAGMNVEEKEDMSRFILDVNDEFGTTIALIEHDMGVVMDLSEDRSEPRVFINPEFEPLTDQMDQYQEGCLSVPGFYENVDRPQKVKIKAQDKHGEPYELIAEGLLAVCIQHECDHLNGKLFVDYLSTLKRDRIKKKLEKQHRQQA